MTGISARQGLGVFVLLALVMLAGGLIGAALQKHTPPPTDHQIVQSYNAGFVDGQKDILSVCPTGIPTSGN